MSGYYRMLHPAVLRAIRSVVRAAEHARKELTICATVFVLSVLSDARRKAIL